MKDGRDQQDQASNVIAFDGARKQTKGAAIKARDTGERRMTGGQWVTSTLLVVLAIGGVFALAVPLLRAAGIVGG